MIRFCGSIDSLDGPEVRVRRLPETINFRVHLVNDHIDAKGKIAHACCLEVGGRKVDLVLSSAVLDSPKRLLTALNRAAVSAGLDYPVLTDPKAKRLLPELIKSTQGRAGIRSMDVGTV
jgi:hypothetical protein